MNDSTALPALIVDDEQDLRTLMQMTLKRLNVPSMAAENLAVARQLLAQHSFSLCLTDLNLPDGNGIDLVEYIQKQHSGLPVAVISAYGNMDLAILALKSGAFDFITKPIQQWQLRSLLEHALYHHQNPSNHLDLSIGHQLLIGESEVMLQLKQNLQKLSQSQAPIYISGETGTEKELLARVIHQLSNRRQAPFVTVNCAAIPEDMLESTFFGHHQSGIQSSQQLGVFQKAHLGSLFLDEVADLPLNMQIKLLAAIQEKTIHPIGADRPIKIDVRILSASPKDLQQLLQARLFREDLYFQIHVINVSLPALRQRGQDILLLANHFLKTICRDWNIRPLQLSEAAKQYLLAQAYPGNVSELKNSIERAASFCEGTFIEVEHLHSDTQIQLNMPEANNHPQLQAEPDLSTLAEQGLEAYLENIEKKLLLQALDRSRWNKTSAAKKLGMSFRSLRYRLKKFGLDEQDEC